MTPAGPRLRSYLIHYTQHLPSITHEPRVRPIAPSPMFGIARSGRVSRFGRAVCVSLVAVSDFGRAAIAVLFNSPHTTPPFYYSRAPGPPDHSVPDVRCRVIGSCISIRPWCVCLVCSLTSLPSTVAAHLPRHSTTSRSLRVRRGGGSGCAVKSVGAVSSWHYFACCCFRLAASARGACSGVAAAGATPPCTSLPPTQSPHAAVVAADGPSGRSVLPVASATLPTALLPLAVPGRQARSVGQ